MIREKSVWACVCKACKHHWTTKDHTLPKVCSKCQSKKWNSDYKLSDVTRDFAPAAKIAETAARLDGVQMNDAMSQFLTRAIIEDAMLEEVIEPEPVENRWEGWSEEQEEYDSVSGETIVYRKQLVKPFRIQEIRRDH